MPDTKLLTGKTGNNAFQRLKNSRFTSAVRDFLGNTEQDIPFKFKTTSTFPTEAATEELQRELASRGGKRMDPFTMAQILRKNPGHDIYGPGAPEIRAQIESQMYDKIPAGMISVSRHSEPKHQREIIADFMKSETKNLNPFTAVLNPERAAGAMLYKQQMDKQIKNLVGKKTVSVGKDTPKFIRDIAAKNMTKAEARKYHPDLLEHDPSFTPEQKRQIEEAIKAGVINLKGGSGKPLPFSLVQPRDTKDRVWARRVLNATDPEYRMHSSFQREMPKSEARDYSNKIDKLEPWMRAARYARNIGIFALPVGVGGNSMLPNEEEKRRLRG